VTKIPASSVESNKKETWLETKRKEKKYIYNKERGKARKVWTIAATQI